MPLEDLLNDKVSEECATFQTRYLWIQERVKEGHLKVLLVRGTNNPAGILTKAVAGTLREKHLESLGFRHIRASRAHRAVAAKEDK